MSKQGHVTMTVDAAAAEPLVHDTIHSQPVPNDNDDVAHKNDSQTGRIDSVGFYEMLRFSDARGKVMVAVGALASTALGACALIYMALLGRAVTAFVKATEGNGSHGHNHTSDNINITQSSKSQLMIDMKCNATYFAVCGGAVWIVAYLQFTCPRIAALCQSRSIRKRLLPQIVNTLTSTNKHSHPSDAITTFSTGVDLIQTAVGKSLCESLCMVVIFIGAVILGFIYSWAITLITSVFCVMVLLVAFLMCQMVRKARHAVQVDYSGAGALVIETLAQIHARTPVCHRSDILDRYVAQLKGVVRSTIKKELLCGLDVGLRYLLYFSAITASFVYGSRLVTMSHNQFITSGHILTVTIAIMLGTVTLAMSFRAMKHVSAARRIAFHVYRACNGNLEPIDPLNVAHDCMQEVDRCKTSSQDNGDSVCSLTKWPNLSVFIHVMRLSRRDWFLIVVGLSADVGVGGFIPVIATILSRSLFVFYDTHAVTRYVVHFVAFGLVVCICWIVHGFVFGWAAARLSRRLRKMALSTLLEPDMAWFDDANRSAAAYESMLKIDADKSAGAGGVHAGNVVQFLSCVVPGFVVGLYHDAALTLVILVFVILFYCARHIMRTESHKLRSQRLRNAIDVIKELLTDNEAYSGNDGGALEECRYVLDSYYRTETRRIYMFGVVHGFLHATLFFLSAAVFAFSAHQVSHWSIHPIKIIITYASILLGLLAAHIASSYMPNFTQAAASAQCLLDLIRSRQTTDKQI